MNLLGQPAFVGRHCGHSEYEVTRQVVDFYADALDDHNELYREVAPPLLHHSECYKFLGEWYLKNLFGNLHARQDWELFAPIRVGSRIRTRSTIIERYHKRGRDYVVNETDVNDAADGRLLVRGRTHQSFLPSPPAEGEEGFVVDTATAKRKEDRAPGRRSPPQPDRSWPPRRRPSMPAAAGCSRDPAATTTRTPSRRRSWASRTSWSRG